MIVNGEGPVLQQLQDFIGLARGIAFLSGPVPQSPSDALTAENELLAFWVPTNPPVMQATDSCIVADLTYADGEQNVFPVLASGQISFARAIDAVQWDASVPAVFDFAVASPWLPQMQVNAGQLATSSGNLYACKVAGVTSASTPPVGTGLTIVDGTVVWSYAAQGSAGIQLSTTQVVIDSTITLQSAQIIFPLDSQGNVIAGVDNALTQDAVAAVALTSGVCVMQTAAGIVPAMSDNIGDIAAFLGVTQQGGAAGAPVSVVISGYVGDTSFNFSPTLPVFLGADGQLTQTAPSSGALLVVGYPCGTDGLIVRPQLPIQL